MTSLQRLKNVKATTAKMVAPARKALALTPVSVCRDSLASTVIQVFQRDHKYDASEQVECHALSRYV